MGGGEGGLSGALSALLVQPWQVNWQGLHPEVGGLSTEHWHRIGVQGYILTERVHACVCVCTFVSGCVCLIVQAHIHKNTCSYAAPLCVWLCLSVFSP